MSLDGQHIVVTGGAGGIGSLLCKELLAQGANVTVVDRTESLSFEAKFVRGDLSTLEGVAAIAEHLQSQLVDILVNLAGIQYFGPCEQQSPQQTALLFAVNMLAPVLLTQALLSQMKARGHGQIVNIGSTFGSINFAHFATYSSSKAGLRGFSEALRREVKTDGITVTYIAPRAVKTPLNTEKILEFGRLTNMHMDEPTWVAKQMAKAIAERRKDVFLGFPEKLFVRLNAIAPRVVDQALMANDRKAKTLFHQPMLPNQQWSSS
ncbi:MAG: SDR family oxidoreductase [Nitrospirota bacterium]|nr:SDR family oxidoreductase [Nitrospirota bacterium]